MGGKLRVRVLVAVLAAGFCANSAIAQAMRPFDVNKAESWTDALAICDVTSFLVTKPDLSVEVIIAPNPEISSGELRRPYFIPPSSFYSKVMKETFNKVQRAGQATADGYKDARYRYARKMLNAYHMATQIDYLFLSDQMRLCYALAVNARQQAAASKDNHAH